MANCRGNSVGVPLHPPPSRLTASSSAIAYYSRITLHSFNSAASQARKTVVHQGLTGDLVEQLLWNWMCHFTVKRKKGKKKDNAEIVSFEPPEAPLDRTSRRLCRICIEDLRR